ncbi:MAG: hypothetical protein VXZ82_03750 [Planctomycetota bacterium]|nr:hypothetical protein [Planctomycetota bacterium]
MIARFHLIILSFACLVFPATIASAQVFGRDQDIVAMYLFQGQDEAGFKRSLSSRLNLRLDRIKSLLELSERQSMKIELALKGDLSRFYRAMERVRAKTKGLDMQNQKEMNEAWQLVSPLYTKIMGAGILDDKSLFVKVLDGALTEEQLERYDKYLEERRKMLDDAVTRAALVELEKSIPLLSDQRAKVIELLESKPFNENKHLVGVQRWQMALQHATNRLIALDQTKLAEILDESQLAAFRKFTKNKNRGALGW